MYADNHMNVNTYMYIHEDITVHRYTRVYEHMYLHEYKYTKRETQIPYTYTPTHPGTVM